MPLPSMIKDPYFSGSKEEIGEGKGKGFNFNYPFPMGATFDEHYKPTVNCQYVKHS